MNLKKYRESKGLSQAQLAEELKDVADGIDVPLISKIERGICNPPTSVVIHINQAEKKHMTQRDRVLKYIQDFGYITSWDAYMNLGVTQLATRIFELKEEGYEFDKEWVTTKNRYGVKVGYAKYFLKG